MSEPNAESGIGILCVHCKSHFVFAPQSEFQLCPNCDGKCSRGDAIRSFLRTTMASTFGYDRDLITYDSKLRDIGDSLGTIELLMKLESEFGISISHEDIEELDSLSDVAEYVESRIG